jgi:hypothetical protein
LARSRSSAPRSAATRRAPLADALPLDAGRSSGPSLAAATLPRVWQGVGYRPLADVAAARPLLDFAAIPWPAGPVAFGWGAFADGATGERLVGALVVERADASAFLHGPVVIAEADPREIATQLVAAGLDHAAAAGCDTVYARPHGLDRIWVRFGFIPLPESALPPALAGRPGAGLFAWRGGTALWTLRQSTRDGS